VPAFLAFVAVSFSAPSTRAQTEEELAQAREAFREALALQAAGDCGAAITKLQAVARVKNTPHVEFNIALCEERLGKLVRALGHYKLALDEAQAGKMDEVARPAAEAIEALERRVPRLTIRRGRGAERVSIVLDGTSLGDASIGKELRRDPGSHIVRAETGGRSVFEQVFKLAEGDRQEVVVEVDATREPPPAVTPDPTLDGSPAPPPDRSRRTLGWVAGGAGVASLAAAGVFLVLRQNAIDELEASCDGLSCPPSAEPTIDRGRLYTGLAQGTAILGVAGVAVGAVLLLGGSESTTGRAARIEVGAAGPFVNVRAVGRF